MANLANLAVLIKTFLRDGYLYDCIADLRAHFPESQLVVMDDGLPAPVKDNLYRHLNSIGHVAKYVPFDSGFSFKSDAAIPLYTTPYVLIGSDDFNFAAPGVYAGVAKLVDVLEENPMIGVASGRVNNVPYEGWLNELEPGKVCERQISYENEQRTRNGVPFHLCDLTVNYSVLRTAMLGAGMNQVTWGNHDIKIGGGEHAAFFLAVKRAGWKVAYVPGVSISEMPYQPNKIDPRYPSFRGRARTPGRPALLRAGVTQYKLFDGTVEVS